MAQSLEFSPRINPWLIAGAVMTATFMEVLDTTVVNVSLPHIAGNLSASTEESTWVLTSYLVSNAIVLPITGWLSGFFGRKRFLISCIIIFTLSSFLCGAAPSLELLIAARILQGVGGGALQPISQAILLESFPREKRGVAMAVFGLGVVVAPIIGPTLGGWITDNYSWRWVFYVNLPVGIAAVLMVMNFVFDPPYLRRTERSTIDYIGFCLLALWISCLQIMLDKGQQEDWFSSGLITALATIAGVALVAFIVWEFRTANPIVDLRVFRNRNFAIGTGLVTIVGIVLYGSISLLPLFLQTMLGYPALQSGLTMSPRGVGSVIGMILVGRLVSKLDPRILISTGLLLLGVSSFALSRLTLEMSSWDITLPNIANGFATALVFVPLTTVAMGSLTNAQLGNATGIFNLMRNIGGGVGIAIMTTFLARNAQAKQALLSSHTSLANPVFQSEHLRISTLLTPQVGPDVANAAATGILYRSMLGQAHLHAFVSDFRLLSFLCFAALPLMLVLRRVKAKAGEVPVH